MPKFAVRYYKAETTVTRYEMTVEAADEDAAYERVRAGHDGELEFTQDELDTEHAGKEFGDGSVFSHMEDADEPFAVCQVI